MATTCKRTQAEQADHEFETKDRLRARGEEKAWNNFLRKSDEADKLIGELHREDGVVNYINLRPYGKGRIKEGSSVDLTEYLIRNHYV